MRGRGAAGEVRHKRSARHPDVLGNVRPDIRSGRSPGVSPGGRTFFSARECKEPSARSFKPVLVGASPTTGAISHNGRVAQPAEALRRERRQCGCKSCRDYQFGTRSFDSEAAAF